MKQKITLKHIAREFGVSISTVSKALKDSKEIGEDTRKRIQAFAKYYNYRPNNIALSLKNRKTKTIGVIIPEVVHHFFAKIVNGIEKVARKNGYNVVVALSNESFEKEVINMETLADSLIDGFIISLSKETLRLQDFHHLHETIDQGMPVVMFDRVSNEVNCDKVIIDDVEGAYLATQFLIDSGRTHILLLTTEDYVNVGKLRTQGYIKAIQENQIFLDSELIIKTVDTHISDIIMPELEKELKSILKKRPEINAIFAVNEIYAAAALRVLRKLEILVPQQVSIICFTDGTISRYSSPTLSTVSQHGEQMGMEAARLLINRLSMEHHSESSVTKVINCTLIDREST